MSRRRQRSRERQKQRQKAIIADGEARLAVQSPESYLLAGICPKCMREVGRGGVRVHHLYCKGAGL